MIRTQFVGLQLALPERNLALPRRERRTLAGGAAGRYLRQLVLAGMGLGRFSRQHVLRDVEQGEQGNVIAVLLDYNPGDKEVVHVVFLGPGQHVPARVRVMLDYLLEQVRLGDD